jgi:transcriptional regulator with XRE-family HTH domain
MMWIINMVCRDFKSHVVLSKQADPMQRKETIGRFRERLAELIARTRLSQAAFAAKVGLDRSTLSQLLSPKNDRLPRADNLIAIATAEHVSIDWLLGLTDEGRLGTDILRSMVEIERGGQSPADLRLERWHDEAAGYKIRYVPATLPDPLKTEQVIEFEYKDSAAFTPEQSIDTSLRKLAYLRRPETEMEVCSTRESLDLFASGQGVWRGLGVQARRAQLRRMIELVRELYPSFRWALYEAKQRYSVPMIIFGPRRAALYVGQMYLVFNAVEHVRVLTQHFDDLVRAAVVQPTEMVEFLERLRV